MHTFTMVLVPADAVDILQAVTDILSFSDANEKVLPHKDYRSDVSLQIDAERFGIPVTDLPALAERLSKVFERKYSVDERGIFCTSTYNYQRCWDYWVIGGRWDGMVQGKSRNTKGRSNYGPEHEQLQYNICPVRGLPPNILPDGLVTPDGQRYDMDCRSLYPTDEEAEQWRAVLRPLLEQYRDCIAVGVDSHL